MNTEKQIKEMARDLENHTCMSQFQAEIASKMLYAKGYRKASDVAEEIFAEIEYLIWQHDTHPAGELTEEIAELKKKYTEGDG